MNPHSYQRSRVPNLLAFAVAVVAVVGIFSSVTPALRSRVELLIGLVPTPAENGAAVLTIVISICLLLVAGGIRRRKHRSWQLAIAAIGTISVLHLIKGFDFEEAVISLVVLTALVLSRSYFDAEGDPATPRRVAKAAALLVLGGIILGWTLVEIQSRLSGHTLTPLGAFFESLADLIGLGPNRLQGRGEHLVPWALVIYALVAIVYLAYLWLRPRSQYLKQHFQDYLDVRELVNRCGVGTLDYFALRKDKEYFFDDSHEAVIAYKISAGVALISANPIGDRQTFQALIVDFTNFSHRHGWRVAAIGIDEELVPLFNQAGLSTINIGDEAFINPQSFNLEGRLIRKVRQSCNRLIKAGYKCKTFKRHEIDSELESNLIAISDQWLGGRTEHGFSMEIDDMWSHEHDECVLTIAFGTNGEPQGFAHFVPVADGKTISLSSQRRKRSTPNGLTEFIFCEAFFWAKEAGMEKVSLNFNAFGEILRSEKTELPYWERVARFLILKADRFVQLQRLLTFNKKFFPEWTPRYVAYESYSDLPLTAIVMLAAESLLEIPWPTRE